jgi:chorismate lyase/3-hydroxybenzoate synthase
VNEALLGAPLRCALAVAHPVPAAAGPEPGLLLEIRYGAEDGDRSAGGPRLALPNHVLGAGAAVERWISSRPVVAHRRGALAWSEDGELLAGSLASPLGADLERAVCAHFAALLALAAERGYPNLLRTWNYLPGINRGAGDRERYRRFNVGRARAFAARFGAHGAAARFAASSAVGTAGEELRSAFVAARGAAAQLENGRQVAAWRYPRRHGPCPPSFRRATLAPASLGGALFVSGTASIVGHETVHAGALEAQIDETLRNLDALLAEARRACGRDLPGLARFDLVKVYLRRASDLERACERLARALPGGESTLYLEADLCRADLLVEIEGVALGDGTGVGEGR